MKTYTKCGRPEGQVEFAAQRRQCEGISKEMVAYYRRHKAGIPAFKQDSNEDVAA